MTAVAIQQNNAKPKKGDTKLGGKDRWREFHQRSRRGLTYNLRLSLKFSVVGLKIRRLMGRNQPEAWSFPASPRPADRLRQIS
jgi:hypothetical protein